MAPLNTSYRYILQALLVEQAKCQIMLVKVKLKQTWLAMEARYSALLESWWH